MGDVLAELGNVFLGSRLKRLAERMQAGAAMVLRDAGLPIQPSQAPLLAALDRYGPMRFGDAVEALGVSQPAVTRSLTSLVALGLVETERARDQRQKRISLTPAGMAAMARVRGEVWPHVGAAVNEMCAGLSGPLLDQIRALEAQLAEAPLDRRTAAARASRSVWIREYSEELAGDFYRINAEWIETMFSMEEADRQILENPRALLAGGAILFAETSDLEVVGTCALRSAGGGAFEVTKMAVLERARGRGAGALLLDAVIARATELGADPLYLLTNSSCVAAIHLYGKSGFVHDSAILEANRGRYARSDVAMRYLPRD